MTDEAITKRRTSRTELRAIAAEAMQTFGTDAHERASVPAGIRSCMEELELGMIKSRDQLTLQERFIVWLSAACVLGQTEKLGVLAKGAQDAGLTKTQISEVFLQCVLYAGTPNVELAFKAANLGQVDSTGTDCSANFADLSATMRAKLHGDLQNKGYSDPSRKHMADLYEIAASYGYGVIWRRPGLDLRHRLFCAMAAMASLPVASASLNKFARTAISHGFTSPEIVEIVIQTAPFCGFPAAIGAMNTVSGAVADRN
ncbi:hypothetical protein EI545_15100 [Tabrizicola piscis]|uniref:Carboxymuconolactone decarboxylase-like domain-containing protein n=1 Tax=Tabrizicola piscis TaxID=2494374 RepID=A0A3S8U8U6_9RHOB|nr:carboxymuconolactone decarboxylase family protein [Tabrizicola piscis]AZL60041.1 hypothetical protein EI545_15100 [Tabrizicola piscis]